MTREELRKIITEYQSYVYAICLNFTKNPWEAENLTQETFLSAYLHNSLADESKYKPYLARIAANKSKDYLRSAYIRKVSLTGEDKDLDVQSSGSYMPEKEFADRSGYEQIKEMILSLNEPYLNVSVLFFLKQKTPEEIADILKRPKKTVLTQLYRAKHILRQKKEEADKNGIF